MPNSSEPPLWFGNSEWSCVLSTTSELGSATSGLAETLKREIVTAAAGWLV